MSTWYEWGVLYHMYPLGMIGAPRHNNVAEVTSRFEELDKWISYIRSPGVNAIYIGPFLEFTNHGYNIRDYKLVDQRPGDNGSFREFVDQYHQEGVKVVMDDVFSHTGREFFTFGGIQERRWNSPYGDWCKGTNSDWRSLCDDSSGYEAWQGHFELPYLNLFNPNVKSYLSDATRFWIDEFDIDGIRLDCANVLDSSFMEEMCSQTGAVKKDFRFMGEVMHGDYSRWANNEMLHSITNYEPHKSLYSGFNGHNFFEIAHNVRRLGIVGRQLYTFVDNRDEDRIATELKLREHLFPIYIRPFTLPGIPFIYYGGEWGVEGKRTNTSDEALRPAIFIEREGKFHCELAGLVAQLRQIHSQQEPLHTGRYQELLLTNRQYAFVKHGEGSVIITAVNNDDGSAGLTISVLFQAGEAVNLLEPTDRLSISDRKVRMRLKGNQGAVLRLRGEN